MRRSTKATERKRSGDGVRYRLGTPPNLHTAAGGRRREGRANEAHTGTETLLPFYWTAALLEGRSLVEHPLDVNETLLSPRAGFFLSQKIVTAAKRQYMRSVGYSTRKRCAWSW